MPSYVYRCNSCRATKEAIQSIKEPALTKCEDCGKDELARVPQPTAIAFKGRGFYCTDNRRR